MPPGVGRRRRDGNEVKYGTVVPSESSDSAAANHSAAITRKKPRAARRRHSTYAQKKKKERRKTWHERCQKRRKTRAFGQNEHWAPSLANRAERASCFGVRVPDGAGWLSPCPGAARRGRAHVTTTDEWPGRGQRRPRRTNEQPSRVG